MPQVRPPTRRRFSPYLFPVLLLLLWLAVESLLVAVGRPAPCVFRLLTGIPCPTCGSTRATLCLLHLDVRGALGYSPFITLAMLALPLVGGLYLVLRARGRLGFFTALSRRSGWVTLALVLLLLLNWIYVIRAERGRGESGRKAGQAAGNAERKAPGRSVTP